MDTNYNNSLSFGSLKLRVPQKIYEAKEGTSSWLKVIQAKNDLAETKFWDLILDEQGYKLEYKNTANIYTIEHKPKRHAPNVLYIRTLNAAHKVKGKITSFKIDFNNMEEVRETYRKITKATGIDKMVMIVKLLEKQAQLKATNRKMKIFNQTRTEQPAIGFGQA